MPMDFRAGEGGFFLLMNFSFLEPEPAEKIHIKKKNSMKPIFGLFLDLKWRYINIVRLSYLHW